MAAASALAPLDGVASGRLTPQQRAIVEYGDGPIMVIAEPPAMKQVGFQQPGREDRALDARFKLARALARPRWDKPR